MTSPFLNQGRFRPLGPQVLPGDVSGSEPVRLLLSICPGGVPPVNRARSAPTGPVWGWLLAGLEIFLGMFAQILAWLKGVRSLCPSVGTTRDTVPVLVKCVVWPCDKSVTPRDKGQGQEQTSGGPEVKARA